VYQAHTTERSELDRTHGVSDDYRVLGYVLVPDVLEPSECCELLKNIERDAIDSAGTRSFMSPLLLHSSSKATGASLRRVLHLLFGPPELPFGLAWHDAA
jgi:hypothetical protein